MIHDYVVVQSLAEMPIDSESEYMESDLMDDSDEEDRLGERMEELIVHS